MRRNLLILVAILAAIRLLDAVVSLLIALASS